MLSESCIVFSKIAVECSEVSCLQNLLFHIHGVLTFQHMDWDFDTKCTLSDLEIFYELLEQRLPVTILPPFHVHELWEFFSEKLHMKTHQFPQIFNRVIEKFFHRIVETKGVDVKLVFYFFEPSPRSPVRNSIPSTNGESIHQSCLETADNSLLVRGEPSFVREEGFAQKVLPLCGSFSELNVSLVFMRDDLAKWLMAQRQEMNLLRQTKKIWTSLKGKFIVIPDDAGLDDEMQKTLETVWIMSEELSDVIAYCSMVQRKILEYARKDEVQLNSDFQDEGPKKIPSKKKTFSSPPNREKRDPFFRTDNNKRLMPISLTWPIFSASLQGLLKRLSAVLDHIRTYTAKLSEWESIKHEFWRVLSFPNSIQVSEEM